MHLRLALATAPVIILLWLGLAGYLVQKQHSDLAQAAQESRNLAHAFEENIRRTVEAIDTTVRALRAARAHDPAHFDIIAWQLDTGLTRDLTLQISVADWAGNVVATNLGPMTQPISIADREHFRQARDQIGDELFISRPVIGRISGKWSVQFVRKLFSAKGAFDGVIIASLDPGFLSRLYTSLDSGRGALLLAGQDGFLRAVAPDTAAKLNGDLSRTPLMAAVLTQPHGTLDMADTDDRIDRTYSWRRVDTYGLVVAVGLSKADALAGYRSIFRGCITIGIALTLITLVVGHVLARSRRDLLRSRHTLMAAVDNISQGLMVIDPQRCVQVLNARAAELLGLPEVLTKPGFAFDALLQWQLDAGEFDGPEAERVRELVRSGGIATGATIYRRTRRNGTVLEISTKTLATGLAVRTFTDITEQEHTSRVLADARDAAEDAVRARSEFLAVMSHEIRTPLGGVIGVAGLLEDMELGPAQRDYVRLIRQSGDHLLALVNDILDFSRLEVQRVQLEDIDFDPATLTQDIVRIFLPQASSKGLHLSAIVADALPFAVMGDPGRLRQVLLNLVGNAVKFTDRGWVSLTLTHEPGAERHVRLMFRVADSGIGIIPEAVERMFEEFTQMDGSISRRFGGSGLGLAICRRLVELMGGTIEVESQSGAGSTFRFDVTLKLAQPMPTAILVAETSREAEAAGVAPEATLRTVTTTGAVAGSAEPTLTTRTAPITAATPGAVTAPVALATKQAEAPLASPIAEATAGSGAEVRLRVLVAEDNPTNRLVALRLLERLGHRADAVGTGIEAIEALSFIHYDLILMDVMMPEMDGLTATRQIRALERPGSRVTVIGLTAGSGADNLAACMAAGMDAVTTKPVTLGRLRSAIDDGNAAAEQRTAVERTPATGRRASTTPRLRELADMLGEDAVAEIVGAFAEDTQANLVTMRAAAARDDGNMIFRSAHSVGGAARNVGADALAERALALEAMAGSLSPAQIVAEIAAMQEELDAVMDGLADRLTPNILDPRQADIRPADVGLADDRAVDTGATHVGRGDTGA